MEVKGNLLHELHFQCKDAIVPHEKHCGFASLRVVPVYRSVVLGCWKLKMVLLFMVQFWGCCFYVSCVQPNKISFLERNKCILPPISYPSHGQFMRSQCFFPITDKGMHSLLDRQIFGLLKGYWQCFGGFSMHEFEGGVFSFCMSSVVVSEFYQKQLFCPVFWK